MTWTKLSDDFLDDCWELSDAAWRLHVEGLVWSNRKLTDLTLKKNDVLRWAKRPGAAAELVGCGWWSDRGDHYEINHHGVYQRTKEQVLKQQQANKRNGSRGGRARPAREQADDLKPSETESLSERDGTGQDGQGQEKGSTQNWPEWRGTGPNPFDEYV